MSPVAPHDRRRRRVWLTTERSILIVKGWQAGTLLMDMGLHPTYVGSVKGWVVDERHLPDVVANLEWRNINVIITEAGR